MPQRSDVTKPISSRIYTITAADNGLILDLGPAATQSNVGTFTLQFQPDITSDFQAIVMGVIYGHASNNANVAFVPVPYRRISLADVASDYALVKDPITGAALIQVPANGLSVGLLVACTKGTCTLVSWDMNGPSAI